MQTKNVECEHNIRQKGFPLPLNSISPYLDGGHEKKSHKLLMSYVGSTDRLSGDVC